MLHLRQGGFSYWKDLIFQFEKVCTPKYGNPEKKEWDEDESCRPESIVEGMVEHNAAQNLWRLEQKERKSKGEQ